MSLGAYQEIKIPYKTERRSGMYIVKAEANQVEKIVDMSIRAFETDVNVGGVKGDCPPDFDSVEWHKQMAREGHLYQAMIGKDLVGAAIVFQDETKNSVYIGRIFIDSIYHRKGYGIRLMECIEKAFPCAAEFNLDTPCWNERTNAFYKKLGYRILKIEDGFVFFQKSFIKGEKTMNKEWERLYEEAMSVLNPHDVSNKMWVGSVASAVLTKKGNIYKGICIDTDGSIGMCAERNALSTMLTYGESEITKVVSVYKDGNIIPSCGICREFMMHLGGDVENIEILLDKEGRTTRLIDLMPEYPRHK